jgi:hypothetical protein
VSDIKKLTKLEVSWKVSNVNVIKDFRLERLSIKVEGKEVMYVYNSAYYDLIPYNKVLNEGGNKFLFIANPFVVMRSILIESWIIREHLARKSIDEKFGKNKLAGMLNKMLEIRRKLGLRVNGMGIGTETEIKKISENMEIFQSDSDDYLGEYTPENKYIKEISADEKKYFDYYPQKYFQIHKKYRII